jgi:hypothetical protein
MPVDIYSFLSTMPSFKKLVSYTKCAQLKAKVSLIHEVFKTIKIKILKIAMPIKTLTFV